jgi:hypothetical protein
MELREDNLFAQFDCSLLEMCLFFDKKTSDLEKRASSKSGSKEPIESFNLSQWPKNKIKTLHSYKPVLNRPLQRSNAQMRQLCGKPVRAYRSHK